jgi:hypothetical protein
MNMSKKTEEGGYDSAENNGWPDETPQGEGTAVAESTAGNDSLPDGNDGSSDGNDGSSDGNDGASVPPAFLAIEEHAKALQIPAPVFAAVRQMQGWAAGKKIEKAEFKEAVTAFLSAPVGGINAAGC